MSLPIDPAALDGDDIGEKRATLEMDHEEALEHVREAFADAGFGVPAEFSPSELLNEKIEDADHDPYYVLGACHPVIAHRGLEASDNRAGGLYPCNVVIWQEEPGRQTVYHANIIDIARLVGIAPDNDEWKEIENDTDEFVEEAWENLDTA